MKHIKILVILFFIGVMVASCGQKYTLTAEIEGFDDDTVFVNYAPVSRFYDLDEFYTDTITASNNKFRYQSPVDEPVLAFIYQKKEGFKRIDGSFYYPQHKYLVLLLAPDDRIEVKGSLHDYYLAYEATGSVFNKEYSELRDEYIEKMSQSVKIELQLDTLMSNGGAKGLIRDLFKKRNKLNSLATAAELDFIRHNKHMELAAYFLTRQKLDTIGKFYEDLTETARNGIFKDMLEHQYLKFQKYMRVKEAKEHIVVGNTAPDFVLKALSGADFSLSSIDDKMIVLDFWGSWCGWCLKGFPEMKEYYKKYKSRIEIVGIACNDTEEKWKSAIEENKLEW